MERHRSLRIVVAASALLASFACQRSASQPATPQPAPKPLLVLNLTSGMSDPDRSFMGLAQARAAMDVGYRVVVFLNVRGPELAEREQPTEPFVAGKKVETAPAPGAAPSPKQLLKELIGRGAEVHVCPLCIKTCKVPEKSLVEGAFVTTKERFFAKVPPGTSVYSY